MMEGTLHRPEGRRRLYLLDHSGGYEALILALALQQRIYVIDSGEISFRGIGFEGQKWFAMNHLVNHPLLKLNERRLPRGYRLGFFLEGAYERNFRRIPTPILLPGGLSLQEEKEAVSNFFLRLGKVIFPDELQKQVMALRFPTARGLVLWVVG